MNMLSKKKRICPNQEESGDEEPTGLTQSTGLRDAQI